MEPTFSAAVMGIDGYVIHVETKRTGGSSQTTILGLSENHLAESCKRISAAIFNSGFTYPAGRILINLSPIDTRKNNPQVDLALALALLASDKQIDPKILEGTICVGELALDGTLRTVPGVLPMALAARNAGFKRILVPRANAQEAALAGGYLKIRSANSLAEAVKNLSSHPNEKFSIPDFKPNPSPYSDFSEVGGNSIAKRAMEIAAAGGHNLLMVGPPSSGKTMMVVCFPSILPELTRDEALEISKIYSVAITLGAHPQLADSRPLRFPHHSISKTTLTGGGDPVTPGEFTLAHNGVLYLDEITEFSESALGALRQPLKEGNITIAHATGTFTYPARFTLLASMDPCLCGFREKCVCERVDITKHFAKIPVRLAEKIDIQTEISRIPFQEMPTASKNESSATIRARVEAAREIQHARNEKQKLNAELQACVIGEEAAMLLKAERHVIRNPSRICLVARTIADLSGSAWVLEHHMAEALSYRVLDKMQAVDVSA